MIHLLRKSLRHSQFIVVFRSFSATPFANNTPNSFLQNYNLLVESKILRVDEHQLESVKKLNKFYNKLLDYEHKPNVSGGLSKLFSFFDKNSKQNNSLEPSLKGVYLYGGVGEWLRVLLIRFFFNNF